MKSLVLLILLFIVAKNAVSAISTPISRAEAVAHSTPHILKHHQTIKNELEKGVNEDAVFVLKNTEEAIVALSQADLKKSIKHIDEAIKKSNHLLKVHTKDAFLVVDYSIDLIDMAPEEMKDLKDLEKKISLAYKKHDFSNMRKLLSGALSEIQVRKYELPVGAYAPALEEAKKLIQEKRYNEAGMLMSELLNSLVVQEWSVPLPFVEAESLVIKAEELAGTDVEAAKKTLDEVKDELKRAQILGYVSDDYSDFNHIQTHIKEVKAAIKKNDKTMFQKLKDKISALLNRQATPVKLHYTKP